MKKHKKGLLVFKFIRNAIDFFYPKTEIVGIHNLSDEPCVIVGNHSQFHGPVVCELYFPDDFYTWCASQMMELKKVPAYAYQDFWSQKPKILKPLFKLISYIIAPFSVAVFNNARTIAVYRDNRSLKTFRETVAKLQSGNKIVIFPEHNIKHNNIVYDFQEGFVDLAHLYYKRTGKELSFVPLYIAPKLKKVFFGEAVRFSADAPIEEERRRICNYLMNEITDIACGLPEHIVIPYSNISKKLYSVNTQKGTENEKKCG